MQALLGAVDTGMWKKWEIAKKCQTCRNPWEISQLRAKSTAKPGLYWDQQPWEKFFKISPWSGNPRGNLDIGALPGPFEAKPRPIVGEEGTLGEEGAGKNDIFVRRFAPTLMSSCRRDVTKEYSVRSTTEWRPEALNEVKYWDLLDGDRRTNVVKVRLGVRHDPEGSWSTTYPTG